MKQSESKPVSVNSNTVNRISSQQLFPTSNQIVIVHRNEEYRLRITSNDKLILTK